MRKENGEIQGILLAWSLQRPGATRAAERFSFRPNPDNAKLKGHHPSNPSQKTNESRMTEVWLRPNRRILLFALVPVGIMGGIGYWLQATATTTTVLGVVGWGFVGLAVFLCVGLIYQCYRPRIAFRNGHVLFYLRSGRPISVPVDVVEAFFLGQGAAHLPATAEDSAESMNLVARLSQREEQWQRRDVKPALGRWCEGYVTIRGTWCEPLTGELIRRLNRRLREVKES